MFFSGKWSDTVFECPSEECIEMWIGVECRFGNLIHLNIKALNELLDQKIFDLAVFTERQSPNGP